MLPTLTIGPAFYFIFFRLDQELKGHYPVRYLAAADSIVEQTLESSYCNETVLYQCLSSITCFSCRTPAELIAADKITSHAVLLGTFKDKVDNNRIKMFDTMLKETFCNTTFYDSDLLLKTRRGQMFFSVDNMNGDESEMSLIREDIEDIVKHKFPAIPLPASWLVFRLILHLLRKPVASLAECEFIATNLSMPTSVEEAIWFFHHNVGSLMHYSQIASLQDTVICDPQIVFDSVNELIIDTFKISNRNIPQKAVDDFYNSGQFSLAHIDTKTEYKRSNNSLTLEQLVDLLKYLNIIAEIKPDNHSQENGQSSPKFIMPAVLKFASEDELNLQPPGVGDLPPCTLIISFKCGFVPFGVFCACVAHLIACQDSMSPKWNFCKGEATKRNKVKFIVDKAYLVILVSRPQHFEIRVSRYEGTRCSNSLSYICSRVRQMVEKTLQATIFKMQYAPYTMTETPISQSRCLFELAFHCCVKSHSGHLMKVIVKDDGYYGECLAENLSVDFSKEHLVWFNEVYTTCNDL